MAKEKKKGEKNQKECLHVIYELKEVHYSLEEAQTKTQSKGMACKEGHGVFLLPCRHR